MGFMEAVSACFSRYVDFQGRSRRSEFWFFALFLMLVGIVFNILMSVVGGGMMMSMQNGGTGAGAGIGILIVVIAYLIFVLGTLLPNIAVGIRRLHDTGRSGWWVLIALVPLVGIIVLIVFWVQDSEAGSNVWGPNPKAGALA